MMGYYLFQSLEPTRLKFSAVAQRYTSPLMGRSIGTLNKFLEVVGAFIIFTPKKKEEVMLYIPIPSLMNSNYHISMHNIFFSNVPQSPTNYIKH